MNKTENLPPERAANLLKLQAKFGVDTEELKKAYTRGAVAIERNMIAKKLTHEATLLKCCTCPTCKKVIDKFEKFGEAKVRVNYDYCHFCGQKIDWSEVE